MNKKFFLLYILATGVFPSFGQQKEQKIVIIKSGKGDVNMDSIIQEHKINKNVMIFSSDSITEDMSVSKGDKGHKVIKIVKKIGDGKEEIIEWSGDGDMPVDIEKEMKNIDINTDMSVGTMTVDAEMEDEEIIHSDKRVRKNKGTKSGKNKSLLGIIIDESGEDGVMVTEFASDSPASKAGIKRGDTILKIGDSYIFNTKSLRKAMLPFDKGDNCPIVVLRSGKEKKIKVKL